MTDIRFFFNYEYNHLLYFMFQIREIKLQLKQFSKSIILD